MDYTREIEINPKIMLGKPIIKGTRLTVELILEELSGGTTIDELINNYQGLKRISIYAAFAFAADALKGVKSYPITL